MPRVKVFFDGGCRPDPGTMEIAVVTAGRTMIVPDAGQGSSMDAEWLALIYAMEVVRSLNLLHVVLIGDSADVVAKANGALKCRGSAAGYHERFCALASAGFRPRVRHVRRSQNLAGIALAKLHPR
jgi:ribonuclease HI